MAERTLDEALDEVDKKEGKEKEEKGVPSDIIAKLEELGFEEKEDKPGLWFKALGDDKFCHWDFRKTKKGRYYVSMPSGFMDDKKAKEMKEYTYVRQDVKEPPKPTKKEQPVKEKPLVKKSLAEEKSITLRGTENDIIALMNSIRLDSIIEVAKDGLGEGVLYYDLNELGMEPSVDAIDMITADMGSIETEIVDIDMHRLIDEDTGNDYLTYYAVVKATDKTTGTTGLGAAEEIIDFGEISKSGRTFSRTRCIRKAERNAKERLIPVPRKALVALIKRMLTEYKKTSEKK